ncbi:MAG: serine/threonine-protein kinase [Pseudomonadota bacterium]
MTNEKNKDLLATGGGLDALSSVRSETQDTMTGRVLGDYTITGLIAEGGMGRVYRAIRTDGSFDREVAIKLSAASGFDERARSLFLQEQQVLAGLNHPHISQLYDASVTDEGWPYIVMELVEGEPIDEFCQQQSLSVEDRVRLLIELTDAVAYAHARLVVHRDIKPSNVLIDASGRSRLLDFGIAKLIDESQVALTRDRPLTPRYASPEQLLSQPITTASDLYQIGILAAEVLTGRPPDDVATLTDAIQRAADARPVSLDADQQRGLPVELVQIINQCLRLAPDERYADANALKRDLKAWLKGYPVAAVGQGAGYRFRKLVERNKGMSALTTILVGAILVGTMYYTQSINEARRTAEVQRDEAERQSRMADESMNFLTSILEYGDPNKSQSGDTSIDDVLEAGAARVSAELADQPEIQVRLYQTIATVYDRQGRYDKIGEILEAAESPTLAVHGEASPEYFSLLNQRGNSLNRQGRFAEGRTFFEDVLGLAERLLGAEHRETLKVRNNLAISTYGSGDLAGFDAITAENMRIVEQVLDEGASLRVNMAHKRGMAYIVNGKLEEAKVLTRRYAEVAEASLGPAHSNTMAHWSLLATAHGFAGEVDEELRIQEMLVARRREVLGPDHPELAFSLNNLAVAYDESGRYDEFEPVMREVIAIRLKVLGENHPSTLHAQRNLAQFRAERLGAEDSLAALYAVLERQREVLGPTHQDPVETQLVYTGLLVARDAPGATQAVTEAMALIEQSIGLQHPVAQDFLNTIEQGSMKAKADADGSP